MFGRSKDVDDLQIFHRSSHLSRGKCSPLISDYPLSMAVAENEVIAEKLNSMLARGVRNVGNYHLLREVIQSDDDLLVSFSS